MAANSWHPTKKLYRELMAESGFAEWVPPHPVGGLVFEYPDDFTGVAMAFVFSWSNFRIAQKEGSAPCSLIVRGTRFPDYPTVTHPGQHLPFDDIGAIDFGVGEWDVVRSTFPRVIMPEFVDKVSPTTDFLAEWPEVERRPH